jgi:hypothetical protein
MASVNVRNCVRFYTTADEIGAETLKEHCSGLISAHWVSWKHFIGIYPTECCDSAISARHIDTCSTKYSARHIRYMLSLRQIELLLNWFSVPNNSL